MRQNYIEKIYSKIFGEETPDVRTEKELLQDYKKKAIVVYITLSISLTFIILIVINILKKIQSL